MTKFGIRASRSSRVVASLAGIALLAACQARPVAKIDPSQQKAERKEVPVNINRDLDILFLIDNSGSMREEQESLAANFPAFVNVLQDIEGGLPNVNIAVVSSNTGIGGYNIPNSGCDGSGDNGIFQNTPREQGCSGPQGLFIKDWARPDCTPNGQDDCRDRNFTGQTLADTFSCIAQLGTLGCGFEQQLEAVKRALDGSNVQNAGFLRPEAFLAVIIISDEDDCSAGDTGIFNPDDALNNGNSELGFLTSFRCFEFGVQCDGSNIARTPDTYQQCTPRTNSFLKNPVEYAEFLKSLKPNDPSKVIVAGIVGNPDPFAVGLDGDGQPAVLPSCSSAAGSAAPSVRMQAFFSEFANRNTVTSICNDDLSDALNKVAELLRRVIGSPCFESDLDTTDLDAGQPGLQLDCQVSDVTNPNTDMEVQTPMRRCQMASDSTPSPNQALPCWYVAVDEMKCGQYPTKLSLVTARNDGGASSLVVQAQCKTL